MKRMSGLDASFLYMEAPTMHMHIVGVVLLESVNENRVVGFDDVLRALDERLHLIPPLRRRMVAPLAGVDHPIWIEDPDFDLRNHVRPFPGQTPVSWQSLEKFVGEVSSRQLDRARPLWEMWIVEGVEGRSTAIVTKLHHSMMDGGAGYDLMASIFDLSPDAASPTSPESPWVADMIPSTSGLFAGSLVSFIRRQSEAPGALIRTAGSMIGTARTWIGLKVSGKPGSLTAPKTIFNGPLSARRSVSLRKVDLDEVKEIRKAFGTTVNDVVIAATAMSLRRYLNDRGGLPDIPLLAAIPVNVRDDTAQGEMGNQVSNMMVNVPLDSDDDIERLKIIHDNALSSKALQSAFGPDALKEMAGFTAPSLVTAGARLYMALKLARFHRPLFNIIISNVPGPPIDLYCVGNRVSAIFPMGPLMEGSGLNITVLSEAHHLNVGVMACPDLAPDVDEIGDGFVKSVSHLLDLARSQ